ncbi:MAG TPA: hypothetical protein VGC76_08095 [Pyrinomonadaceae bacterium]|jgi:hypothetical protein
MITAHQIEEILSLYKKHGWNLRRVLLSDELRVNFNELLQPLFGGAEIVSSPFLNALWFSRASGKTGETWEIRHLSPTPFALVQVFPNEMSEDEREEIRNEMQTRLVNQTSNLPGRKSEN